MGARLEGPGYPPAGPEAAWYRVPGISGFSQVLRCPGGFAAPYRLGVSPSAAARDNLPNPCPPACSAAAADMLEGVKIRDDERRHRI